MNIRSISINDVTESNIFMLEDGTIMKSTLCKSVRRLQDIINTLPKNKYILLDAKINISDAEQVEYIYDIDKFISYANLEDIYVDISSLLKSYTVEEIVDIIIKTRCKLINVTDTLYNIILLKILDRKEK